MPVPSKFQDKTHGHGSVTTATSTQGHSLSFSDRQPKEVMASVAPGSVSFKWPPLTFQVFG